MKKVLASFIMILLILSTIPVTAASYSLNLSGPAEATKDQTVTLTITGNGLTGAVSLTAKNASLSTSQVWVEKNSVNVTATISGFPAVITATAIEPTDNEYNIVSVPSKSVTINEKKQTNIGNNGGNTNTNNGNNNGGSGNTGNNGGGNGNSGGTTMPSESGNNKNNNNKQDEKPKSSNNYLSSISIVGGGKLSPEFYRETYEYAIEFDEDVNLYELNEIEIEAKAEDERATVKGVGKVSLQEGENKLEVTVTAENASERTYTLKIEKPKKIEQSELRLKTLILNGIDKEGVYKTINLELDPEVFEYNLVVPNEITALSINPTTENEDVIIEKVGGEVLEEGDNKIDIILTSPSDREVQTTYTLNVQREAKVAEVQGVTKEQIIMIAAGGIIGLIILITVIVLIVKRAKKKKQNNYDESELDFTDNFEYNDDNMENSIREAKAEEEIQTVDDIELPKLNWLDENEDSADIQEDKDEENIDKKKDKKSGKRFV